MPQEQNDLLQIFCETLASVAEGDGDIKLTNEEKEFVANEFAGVLLRESEEKGTTLAEQFDRLILTMDEKDVWSISGMHELDTDRVRMIICKMKRHREAFVALDNIRETERTMHEGGPKGSIRH